MIDALVAARCRLSIEPTEIRTDAGADIWLLLLAAPLAESTAFASGSRRVVRGAGLLPRRATKTPFVLDVDVPRSAGPSVVCAVSVAVERPRRSAPARAMPDSVTEMVEALEVAIADAAPGPDPAATTWTVSDLEFGDVAPDTVLGAAAAGVAHVVLRQRVERERIARERAFRRLTSLVEAGRGRPPLQPSAAGRRDSPRDADVVASRVVAHTAAASFRSGRAEVGLDLSPRRPKGRALAQLRGRLEFSLDAPDRTRVERRPRIDRGRR